jgi:hypothetical protein
MCYKVALSSEGPITHITSIRAVTIMNALMFHKTARLSEGPITHITSIRALTTLYALMCCKVALLSEGPITHFTCIWTLNPIYITGISTFSTVRMTMFIQRTLLKKRNLNIRINSDKNNNYFYYKIYVEENPIAFEELYYLQELFDD